MYETASPEHVTAKLLPTDDDVLLDYLNELNEDGKPIELTCLNNVRP